MDEPTNTTNPPGHAPPELADCTPRPRKGRTRNAEPPIDCKVKQEELDLTLDLGYDSSVDLLTPTEQAEFALELEQEKKRYPGSSTWAKDEERLFEILFQRSERPFLPMHWDVDFRGVPMMDSVFQTSDDEQPIIYSHSAKEFQATMALLRLIDLTSSVRTACQSGLRDKAPLLIKKGLDKFLNWAAEDGGYSNLKIVPNIMVDTIDTGMREDEITAAMERRMRALAKLQREFLRVERDPSFWDIEQQRIEHPVSDMHTLLIEKHIFYDDHPNRPNPADLKEHSELKGDVDSDATPVKRSVGEKQQANLTEHLSKSRLAQSMDHIKDPRIKTEDADSPIQLSPRKPILHQGPITPPDAYDLSNGVYRRQPPVIYGLFILRTSVFLLTVDSAKGDTAYVSFHVDMHFADRHQSVWNALTVAIAVCLARDQLMARLDEFDTASEVEESDPDALQHFVIPIDFTIPKLVSHNTLDHADVISSQRSDVEDGLIRAGVINIRDLQHDLTGLY